MTNTSRWYIALPALWLASALAACDGKPPVPVANESAVPAAQASAVEEQPSFDAAAEFVALSAGEAATAADWFSLAQRARAAGDLDTAREALDLAAKDFAPGRIAFEKARIAALGGDSGSAVAILRELFHNGFTAVQAISSDSVLGSLAGDPAFDTLIDEMTAQAFPCEHDERFAEFDFWVGNWDVLTSNGQQAGTNRIERAESGCVITEHWSGAGGGTGSSINYLDRTSDEWVQIWNSQGGTQINIRGGLTDDGMSMSGHIHYVSKGTTSEFRGLWTPLPDGRVRQYFEQYNDEDETWAPWFEGFYTRQSDGDDTQ